MMTVMGYTQEWMEKHPDQAESMMQPTPGQADTRP